MAARSKSSPDVVSLSAFGFLFSELVQYSQNKIENSADLEATLKEFGISVGRRVVETHAFRSRSFKRETTIVGMLQFISNVIFKSLLGKTADNIQQSLNSNKEYMLHEKDPITNCFVSLPKGSTLNCAAYIGGIIEGALVGAGFPAEVTAHLVTEGGGEKTVFLIKFD